MAGRRSRYQNTHYAQLPPESAMRANARLFYDGGAQDGTQDLASARRDVAQAVRDKVEWARTVQASDAADQILGNHQGADPVSEGALRTLADAYKGVADLRGQEAAEARTRADRADERVAAAHQAGHDTARAQSAVEIGAMERLTTMAVETVKSVTTAQREAERAAAAASAEAQNRATAAEVKSAYEVAGLYKGLNDALLALVTRQQQQPAQQPANPFQALADAVKGFQALGLSVGPQQPAGMNPVDDAMRMKWFDHTLQQSQENHAAGRAFVGQLGTVAQQIGERLGVIPPGILPPPSANPGGAVNGIPNTPPPAPGGA